MKKVLLISENFYPSNVIGAVRPTKFSKYLTKLGYEVDVITKNPVNDEQGKKYFKNLYAWCGSKNNNSSVPTASNNTEHSFLYKKLYSIYHTASVIKNSKSAVKKFEKTINDNLDIHQYDAVISSFGPLSSLFCGMKLKKKYPNIKWICDFRDPVVVDIIPKVFKPYYKYLQNKACRLADVITTVSSGYLERICQNKYNCKAKMIPNGYDNDDLTACEVNPSDNKLTLAYAGILYSGKRDISPVFKAIRELINEGKINTNKISVEYAGKDFSVLSTQAKKYNLENIVVDRGQMSRNDCLNFQYSSNILLLATWNEKNEIGVFPGKFLEYMLMKKPIISLVSGNLPESEVKKVMDKGNFGICYEESADLTDFPLLKNYIKEQYESFVNNKKVLYCPNENILIQYDWNALIKKIEELI